MNHIYYWSRYLECMDGAMRNDKEKWMEEARKLRWKEKVVHMMIR